MVGNKRFASFVDAMKKASELITKENPDYLVVPMLGSVPLIDTMAIVNKDFDASKAVYMPASSRILDVKGVIRGWYSNFLDDVTNPPSTFPYLLGIDEVVSGQSVTRCIGGIDEVTEAKRRKIRQSLVERLHSRDRNVSLPALSEIDVLTDNAYALELSEIRNRIINKKYLKNKEQTKKDSTYMVGIIKDVLSKNLVYKTIGIEDSKQLNRNIIYENYKLEGRVLPISVETIITMDKPELVPPRFKILPKENQSHNGYVRFSPEVIDFKVTPEYINFLRSLSTYIGKNPDDVSPVNMTRILDSSRYLTKQ